MGLALQKSGRIFMLHVRCANCVKDSTLDVFVPAAEGDLDSDELMESSVLASVKYVCTRCDSAIGQIVGVTRGSLV